MSLQLEGPSSAIHWQILESKFNEEPARLSNNLRLFKEWIRCTPHLPQTTDDVLLVAFLRFAKQDLNSAKQRFKSFCILMTGNVTMFHNIAPNYREAIDAFFDTNDAYISPQLTREGHRLLAIRLRKLENFKISEVHFKFFHYAQIYKLFLDTPRLGDVYVIDIGNITNELMIQMTNAHFLGFMRDIQKVYPSRIAAVHYTRVNKLVRMMVNLVRPFLGKKISERFHFHDDCDLTDFFSPDELPSDFGGTKASLEEQSVIYKRHMMENQALVAGVESYRCTGPIAAEYKASYGVDGSFRQLAID